MDSPDSKPVAQPVPASVIPPASKQGHTPIGPIVGAIIVTLILVAGGLYFWGAKLNTAQQSPPPFIPSNDVSLEGDLLGSTN
jgi:hypothetical protein